MSDLRATERLLEFVETQAYEARSAFWQGDSPLGALDEIDEAITELRRRGDTLVRRDDLRLLIDAAEWDDDHGYGEASTAEAIQRIENALGGKMR